MRTNRSVTRNPLIHMYVCLCNAVTDREIRLATQAGIDDFPSLQAALGVATQCGCCRDAANEILQESRGTVGASQHASIHHRLPSPGRRKPPDDTFRARHRRASGTESA